jgi:mRNA-degrading endonuclease RelE of RelBE toxin-antitoxin system
MKTEVRITKSFKKAIKPLLKKYSSLIGELTNLESELIQNPHFGTPLGDNSYKIRLKIKSKQKGKSGGARVITYLETEIIGIIGKEDETTTVYLLTIYDKSDIANITDSELRELIIYLES